MISERVSPMLATWLSSWQLSTSAHAHLVAALDADGEHRAQAARAVLLQQRRAVLRQAGIGDPGDVRVVGEPGRDLVGVGDVAVHAQGQGLDALDDQEGVEGRQRRAHVAQPDRLVADGEREIAEGLEEAQAVIGLGRLAQQRELAVAPVEPAALDDGAADRVALAAQIFGHRVDDDVGPPFQRLAEVGGGQGVVDDQRHAVGVGDGGDGLDVGDDPVRVGRALDEQRPGSASSIFSAKFCGLARVDEAGLPAELREGVGHLRDRAAVELGARDHVVAGAAAG